MDIIAFIDHLGTFAFAVSGIRLSASKEFDWFGAYMVGLVTAIGGGTTRDLLLNEIPFWMSQPSYLIVTGVALIFVLLLGKYIVRMHHTLFIFDSIGLGLFVVTGIDKTLASGFPFWLAIIMGMITGSVGGVIRDILINETPLIFRKDFYALACIVGGLVYGLCLYLNANLLLTQILSAGTVILSRIIAVKFHVGLPTLKD